MGAISVAVTSIGRPILVNGSHGDGLIRQWTLLFVWESTSLLIELISIEREREIEILVLRAAPMMID